jgi:hypothetical protein
MYVSVSVSVMRVMCDEVYLLEIILFPRF